MATASPIDLQNIDKKDGKLIQHGLNKLGFYSHTYGGVPGPKTKAAYDQYRDGTDGPVVEVEGLLDYSPKVDAELDFPGVIVNGATGKKARRVQEWLTLNKFRTAVDDDFGDATERSVKKFQSARSLSATGKVDQDTWNELISPLTRALSKPKSVATGGLPEVALQIAKQHLREHPLELDGKNRGPWVRTYMNGNEGPAWFWCAGFVTFVMKQASQILGVTPPIKGSFSCDVLASQANSAGLFVSGSSRNNSNFNESDLGTCCIFLVRKVPDDWTHTGFAFDYDWRTFDTIEGNTNDDGSRNGYEVCERSRAVKKMDFIKLT